MKNAFFVFCSFLLFGLFFQPAFAETPEERKVRLENELKEIERQILTQQVLVDDKQLERQSLERDINLLDAQIKKAKLGIQARTVAIEQLDDQIQDKSVAITELDQKLNRQRQSLSQLLRKTQEIDDYTLIEIMLGRDNFSKFFEDIENFQSIKLALNSSLEELKEIKSDTLEQRQSLEEKQLSEEEMKTLQVQEKATIEAKEKEKAKILVVTKGEEKEYQKLLETSQKSAAQIRAQLFELSGGGGAIPFPEAVALADFASNQTGVPTTLILAILEQESSYGSNIGRCVFDDIVQGKTVMHPDRDQPIFHVLSDILGFNPRSQQVSCPWIRNGTRVGWGGAMGPSQFIPSTWAIYGGVVNSGSGWEYEKDRDVIRSLTGKSSPSSPFNNQDAFMATALLMRDNGAGSSYKSQWTSAIRYFAGWGGASNPINFPYGDNVMARKARLDGEVAILKGG